MNVHASDKWKHRFLELAYMVSSWSKDRSTRVGAVIVTPEGEPRSFGFNGMPFGIDDTVEERHNRPEKYLWFEHAERNAIYLADGDLRHCIIFCTHMPCPDCARAIIQKRITRVVTDSNNGMGQGEHWKDQHNTSLDMLKEAGVVYEEIDAGVGLGMFKKVYSESGVVDEDKWYVLPNNMLGVGNEEENDDEITQ